MKSSYSQYAKDWHQCSECDCTRPAKELRTLTVTDPVLKLEHDVYRCLDEAVCGRLKEGRKEALRRELEAERLAIASKAIRPRRRSA